METNRIQLQSQWDELKELDDRILGILLKDASEEVCDKEVDETYEHIEKVTRALLYLEKEMTERDVENELASNKLASNSQQVSPGSETNAASNRLPVLNTVSAEVFQRMACLLVFQGLLRVHTKVPKEGFISNYLSCTLGNFVGKFTSFKHSETVSKVPLI